MPSNKSPQPDLVERTFQVMREHRCTYREARRILASHGATVRAANKRRTTEKQQSIEAEQNRMDRMRLN